MNPDDRHPEAASSSLEGVDGADCSEVLGRVFFFLDNELDQADCAQIEHHLEECGPCLARYDLERTVKTLVARSCSERAPEALRQRVMVSIREVQVEIVRTDPRG
jgi:mycothiol system anti-sigma-R factor